MGTYFRLVFSDKSSIDITDTELYLDLYCTDFPDGGCNLYGQFCRIYWIGDLNSDKKERTVLNGCINCGNGQLMHLIVYRK